jgi:hypothetical protein
MARKTKQIAIHDGDGLDMTSVTSNIRAAPTQLAP